MVAAAPGGGTDAIARIFATKLTEIPGRQFVVDNRAGGAGIIGTETVARALRESANSHDSLMALSAFLGSRRA